MPNVRRGLSSLVVQERGASNVPLTASPLKVLHQATLTTRLHLLRGSWRPRPGLHRYTDYPDQWREDLGQGRGKIQTTLLT